jgi:DNA-binding response OmpR family regulator
MANQTLLFVDDEPWLTEPMRITLEARGFRCEVKREATAAWQYLLNNPVSVLITDIMMPAGDAFANVDSAEAGYVFIEHGVKSAGEAIRNEIAQIRPDFM